LSAKLRKIQPTGNKIAKGSLPDLQRATKSYYQTVEVYNCGSGWRLSWQNKHLTSRQYSLS